MLGHVVDHNGMCVEMRNMKTGKKDQSYISYIRMHNPSHYLNSVYPEIIYRYSVYPPSSVQLREQTLKPEIKLLINYNLRLQLYPN